MKTGDTGVEKFLFVFSLFHKGEMYLLCGLLLIVYGCLSNYSVYSPELTYARPVSNSVDLQGQLICFSRLLEFCSLPNVIEINAINLFSF
jgi:hypothetical protein